MMNKQYDWFATRIFQPELSLDELFDQGITPENTGFKTRDDYRNMASVRDQFRTEDGGFDEDAFNNAYNSSREMYNLYTNREYSKKLLEEFAYDPYEWYAPATGEIIDVSASNTPTQNGMFYSTNIAGIGENTESPYSVREIAQQQLVHDENGNQLDWTPEDKGGLLKGLLRNPLVLATYDEDTPEYDNDGNLLAVHKKGEYKLNEWGAPYYELLGDRDAYGKEMLHYSDTFTREGTILNKFDFYDSDGKRKSVFGTAMKTAAQIVPMFMAPAIKYTWGAINAAKGIGQSMAVLSKGIDAIITGEDDNEFGRAMTKMENWLARFDNSKSDFGNEHMWTSAETYGDLFGSVAKQLFEQRVIASIPKHLKFLGTDIKRSKIGQDMAIAYMAATSAKESYASGIEAGLGDRQAGLLLLANTAAMWKLMDSDYGRSTLFKGSWFDDDIAKKTAKETADQMVKAGDAKYTMEAFNEQMAKNGSTRAVKISKEFAEEAAKQNKVIAGAEKAIKKAQKDAAKQAKKDAAAKLKQEALEKTVNETIDESKDTLWYSAKNFLKDAFNNFSNNLKGKLDAFTGLDAEEYLSAMLREGVEEVAEEAISDVTKATTLALEALGVKMNDTGQKLDFGFSGKDIFDRYLLSFLGGAVGGGIFRGYTEYENYLNNGKSRVLPNYQKDLIFLIAEGRGDEVIAEYKRLYDKGLLGSTELKSDKSSFKMHADENVDIAKEGELSQADANLKVLVGNVRFLEQILHDEGLFDAIKQSKESDIVAARNFVWNKENDHLTENQKRGAFLMLKRIGAHQLMTHDFIKLANDFAEAKTWLIGTVGDLRGKDNLTEDEKRALENAEKHYTKRIKELRQKRDDILDGKYNASYASSILLETEGVLQKLLKVGKLDKDGWAIAMYGKTYNSLNPLYQAQVDKDIELYNNEEANFYGRNFWTTHDGTKRTYFALEKKLHSTFEELNELLKGKRFNEFHTDNYFGQEFFQSMVDIEMDQAAIKSLEHKKTAAKTEGEIAEIEGEIAKLKIKLNRDNQRLNNYRYKNGMSTEGENAENLVPTSMLLQRFKDDDGALDNLIKTYHEILTNEDVKESVPNLLEQISSIYTKIKTDGGLVQDFGELKMAEQALINYIDKLKVGAFIFDEEFSVQLSGVTGTTPETYHDAIKGTLLEPGGIKRDEFLTHLDTLQEALKKSDYKLAKIEYGKMQALVLDTIKALNDKPGFLEELQNVTYDGYLPDDVKEYLKRAFYFPKLGFNQNIQNPFDLFFNVVDIASNLNTHPLLKILEAFDEFVYEEPEKVASAARYVEKFFNEYTATRSWSDFFIANIADQDVLKELLNVLDLIEILISTDTQTVKAMNTFHGDADKLVEFDPISRRNLLKNIDVLKNKIYTVYCNGKFNSRNKHAEIETDWKVKTIQDVQNLIKFWGDIEDKDRNPQFDIKKIWENIINESNDETLKNFLDVDAKTLTDAQFNRVYKVLNRFKTAVYNAWSVIANDKTQNAAAVFVNLFKTHPMYKEILLENYQNPYDKYSISATKPVESFEYLLSLISVDGAALDLAYKKALQSFAPSDSSITRIPNDEQEAVNKFAAAFLSNPGFWKDVRATLVSELNSFKFEEGTEDSEKAEYLKKRVSIDNTLIIPGSCGVGKTTMVGLIMEALWQGNKNIMMNAPKSKTAEGLGNTFGNKSGYVVIGKSEKDGEVDGKEALFKYLFGDDATNKFEYEFEKGTVKINQDKYPFLKLSDLQIKKLEKYELLLVDEIGQYNEIELQLIDKVAKEVGFYVVGLGDHCQMGDLLRQKQEKTKEQFSNSNYQDVAVWKTPYLVRSMRDTSIAKGANNAKLGRTMYAIESLLYKEDETVSEMIINNNIPGIDVTTNLKYSYLLESGICGDKISTDEKDFDKVVEHILKTRRKGQTVSIVIDQETRADEWRERFKKLDWKENEDYVIKNIEKNEINGYETTYTIVDVDWSKRLADRGAKTIWKEFYTISQRSHMASIFLDKTDSLKTIHIVSGIDSDAHRIWGNDPSFVRKWYEYRMSLFDGGDYTGLFKNPESAFARINHSMDDEEKRRKTVGVPPTVEELAKEKTKKSKKKPEKAEEKKKDVEKTKLEEEKENLRSTASHILEQIKLKGFSIKGDTIEAPELSNIDSMNNADCITQLKTIESLLKDIKNFEDIVAKSDSESRSYKEVDDKIKILNKYKSFLTDSKINLEKRIAEIAKSVDITEATKNLQEYGSNINALIKEIDDSTSNLEKIIGWEFAMDEINRCEQYINNLQENVLNEFKANGHDLKKEISQFKSDVQYKIDSVNAIINKNKKDFMDKNPKPSSDDIETIDKYSSLPKEERDNVVSKIQKVIEDYDKAIEGLAAFEDIDELKEDVKKRKDEWEDRKIDLEILAEKLSKDDSPDADDEIDLDKPELKELNDKSKEASRAWENFIVGVHSLENAISGSQNVIDLANKLLNGVYDFTDAELELIEKIRNSHQDHIDKNAKLLEEAEEQIFKVNESLVNTRGFKVNQKFSEKAEFNYDESKKALKDRDASLNAESVAHSLFSRLGAERFLELWKETETKDVYVWGLDLETTSANPYKAELAQIGLVKYKISRKGNDWKIEPVTEAGHIVAIDEFVKPNTDGLEPVEYFDSKKKPGEIETEEEKAARKNPIYDKWKDTDDSKKLTEADALQKIFETIGENDYVVTYNGADYDLRVLKLRASKLLTRTIPVDNWKHIDVYADILGIRDSRDVRGSVLLWNGSETDKIPITHLDDKKLATLVDKNSSNSIHEVRQLPTNGAAHDAITDVHATLDVMINMFNGITTYQEEQSFIESKYGHDSMSDDLYFSDVLMPHAEGLHKDKFKDVSVRTIFESLSVARHKILHGDIKDGDKEWVYNSLTGKSTLYFRDSFSQYDGLPLIVVDGERSGYYKGTFKYIEPTFYHGASEDIDLLELKKRYPTLRFSKPFVLTGLRYNKTVHSTSNLSRGAKEFYDPDKTGGNLGKTYVLVTADPTYAQNWDPTEALSVIEGENGLDWRDTGFKMLTVSRDVDLQQMIDFSIASCCLAADKVAGGTYMHEYFSVWKKKVDEARKKLDEARTPEDRKIAKDELDKAKSIIGGLTLAKTQYEKILDESVDYKEKIKLFHSDVFAVMDGRRVGDFLASFVNACTLHDSEIRTKLHSNGNVQNLPTGTVSGWIIENLIQSVKQVPHYTGWNPEDRYGNYLSLDIIVNGVEFTLVAEKYAISENKDGKGLSLPKVELYLFQKNGDVDISDRIAEIENTKNRSLKDVGVKLSQNNSQSDLIDELENYFGEGKAFADGGLTFDKLALMTTSSPANSKEIRTYPTGSNEVFTRAFTVWNNSQVPIRLEGWNEIFDLLREGMKGYKHGIYGREVIDKAANNAMDNTIFSPSLCTNALNGEYKARTTRMTSYGKWKIMDDAGEVDVFKDRLKECITKVTNLGNDKIKTKIESKIDILSQNAKNRGLSDKDLLQYVVNEANNISKEIFVKQLVEEIYFINSSGAVEKTIVQKDPAILAKEGLTGYDFKDHYYVNSDNSVAAYITYKGEPKVENIQRFVIEEKGVEIKSFDLTHTDANTLLFKNILLSLWDKEINIGDEPGSYLGYLIQKVKTKSTLSDTILKYTRDRLLSFDMTNVDSIFTPEIQKELLKDPDINDLVEIGEDFYTALELVNFDPYSIIC